MDELTRNSVVECPYNKSHKIARSRLQIHLVKCEKNYPENYRIICPFNATHRFTKSKMLEHIENCPMRQFMQPELYQKCQQHGSIKSWQPSEIDSNFDLNECWEDDCESIYKQETNTCTIDSIQFVREDENYKGEMRSPRGYSEAMLVEPSEGNSVLDDLGSVISSMCMGRGVAKPSDKLLYQRIGRGRGKPIKDD